MWTHTRAGEARCRWRTQVSWGQKFIQILGPSLRKIQNYEYKIGQETKKYNEKKRLQQIANLKSLTNITNISKIQKNNYIFINYLPDTPLSYHFPCILGCILFDGLLI
jgi:hypothetical protein